VNSNWTYKVIDVKAKGMRMMVNAEETQDILNQQGMQGWELVNVVQLAMNRATLYFKKPK
jgi:ABC-type transporter MlaC component